LSIEFEEPILGWRSLKDIHDYYLAQTPSEDGICAAGIIAEAELKTRIGSVAIQVQTESGTLSPEQRAQGLALIKDLNEQAKRMRIIATHNMTKDAAAGRWFAIGRVDGVGKHQLIHPSCWNFLLLNIQKGAVGRDSLHYEDLRCAFTRDVPESNPVLAVIRSAQNDAGCERNGASVVRLQSAPSLSPEDPHEPARTGAPGRPSSMHLVVAEFERRCGNSEVIWSSVKAEAEYLAAWFKKNHPGSPRLTARTIENKIRPEYRLAKLNADCPTKL